jgi:2-C-methyl-D-erythritol 4-phosphate cytidylyltransferase/2-C-methyl-D-erythritol 2,4-cyclodiphosphate synthase
LADHKPDSVLIHDAARPFLEPNIITKLIDVVENGVGAIAALPVVDTLRRVRTDRPTETVDRSGVWRAQTPQGFKYEDIRMAHEKAKGLALTDDAAVAEHSGITIAFVEGNEDNFKITTEADFERAEQMMAHENKTLPRTGFGYDVHRLGPGNHVWLCGVRIDHDQGLIGHSDADVGLHALTDAILGALAEGDIGAHFPDTDPRWKGASSDRFLAHAATLVHDKGGSVNHVDVTLVCESPRIRPYHQAMVERIAEITGLKTSQVSVKATTTEKLGFTGRSEGIAAQAVATILLPTATKE